MANTPVRQYIGARYVPLFADPAEWDKTKTYEPLTIVLHEGNSYTSRQYVPTGININNNEYWALTGNYNAQVEQYRRDTQSVLNKTAANETSINNINANLSALHANTVENATDLYNTIQYSQKRKHIIFIGDSITAGYGLQNPETDTYTHQLSSALNMTEHTYAQDGAGFVANATTAPFNSLNTLTEKAIADTTFNHNDVGVIFLMGGINDDYTQANAAATNCTQDIIKLHTSFPNATIYLGICPTCGLSRQNNKTIYSGIPAASPNIAKLSAINLPYVHKIQAWNLLWQNPTNTTDGLHPNKNGHKALSSQLLSTISGTPITTNIDDISLWGNGSIRSITTKEQIPDDNIYSWIKTHLNNINNTFPNLIATENTIILKSSISIKLAIDFDGTQPETIRIPITKLPTFLQKWRPDDFYTYIPSYNTYQFSQNFSTIGDETNIQVLTQIIYNYQTSCVEIVVSMSKKPTTGTFKITLLYPTFIIPLVGINA